MRNNPLPRVRLHSVRIGFVVTAMAVTAHLLAAANPRLINLAVRGQVGTGADVLIAGFVVSEGTKKVVVRGVGPGLEAFSVPGFLADPIVTVYDASSNALATNDSWDADNKPNFDAVGAFPLTSGSADAGLVLSLPPGGYSAVVSGKNSTTGVALVEVYDLGEAAGGDSIPAAPVGLESVEDETGVTLTWEPVDGAVAYKIFRGVTPLGEAGEPIATDISATTYLDTGAQPGYTYYYIVRAVNAAGASADSNETSVALGPPAETLGGGTLESPANGPAPSFGIGGEGVVLVKNWNFGTEGTIKSISDLSAHFQYHDQFGTIANGSNYGALMVAPNQATAINDGTHGAQPVEGPGVPTTREFTADALRTLLVPLDGATSVKADQYNVGCGSFVAKFTLPHGGSLLNQEIVWETRVRMVTPPYFWFAIWAAGQQWSDGAEMDVVESFGWDNGGGSTNFDGRYWHSDCVGGTNTLVPNFVWDWPGGMASVGVDTYDASEYHIWTWHYRKDDTYDVYVDGVRVQSGTLRWTLGGTSNGTPLSVYFLFDGGFGHTQIDSVNRSLPASDLTDTYYDWDYSRVYLKP